MLVRFLVKWNITHNPHIARWRLLSRGMAGDPGWIRTTGPQISWNKRKYNEEGGLGNEKSPSEFVTNLVDHLGDCKRVLNKQGSFFLVLGDTFENGNLLSIPHRVALGLQDEG